MGPDLDPHGPFRPTRRRDDVGGDCSALPYGRLQPRNVSRHALPAAVAELPIVGVAAGAWGPVRLRVGGAGVDDGEVAEDADDDVVLADALHWRSAADLRQKGVSVDQHAIRVGVAEVSGKVGVEPG